MYHIVTLVQQLYSSDREGARFEQVGDNNGGGWAEQIGLIFNGNNDEVAPMVSNTRGGW